MPVRLKGNTPKPGEIDKRYYMIDVQEGKRRERISSGTRDKKLAERKEQDVLDALRADITIPREELIALVRGRQRAESVIRRRDDGELLKDAIKLCMEDPEVWGRNADRKKNAERMAHVLTLLGADIRLNAIDDEAIDKLRRALYACGNAPATINRKFSALRVVLNNAVERKVLPFVPKIKKQKGERKRKYILSHTDELELYAAMLERDAREQTIKGGHPVKRDAADYVRFFKVLGETGMRPAELFSLPWRNIDLQQGIIKVVHSVHAGTRTKTGRDRYLPITERCHELLLELWGVVKGGPFANLNHRRANDHWKAARTACGITDPDCVPYAQRHTVATKIGEATGDIKAVQAILGHSTIALTADTYMHTTTVQRDKVADALNSRRRSDEALARVAPSRDRDYPVTGTSPTTTSRKVN